MQRNMTDKSLLRIEKQIEKIKQKLLDIGEMRPGSLTKQYRNAKEKKWEFFQLSYTHKMKSKTEYVRAPHVDDLTRQVDTYKRFKALIEKNRTKLWSTITKSYKVLVSKRNVSLVEPRTNIFCHCPRKS